MDERTHEILLRNDSATHWEYPPDVDWSDACDRVSRFRTAAEAVLGQPLTEDTGVQDASYFAELYLPRERLMPHGGLEVRKNLAIRFSNFGRMATILADEQVSSLDRYPVDRLVGLLQEHGFTYIDARALNEPYDGKADASWHVGGPFTWWLRYFDYL